MDIKDRIKTRRLELKLSHGQLADEVSRLEGLKKPLAWQAVQQWENGKTVPRPRRLAHVAKALRMPIEALMEDGPARPAIAALPPATAMESSPRYQLPAWPFQVVSREQVAQLSSQQLASLELLMVRYLLQPTVADWRAVAIDLAEQADHANRADTFTTFVRAVDLKLRELAAQAQPEGATRQVSGEYFPTST